MREDEVVALREEQRESEEIEEASAQKITELTHELRGARGEVILHQARADEYKEQLENEQRRVFGDDEMRRATQELAKKAQLLTRCHQMVLRVQTFAAWRDAVRTFKTVQRKSQPEPELELDAADLSSRTEGSDDLWDADRDASQRKSDTHTHAELARVKAELAVSQSEMFELRDRSERVAQNELHTRELRLKNMVRRMQLSSVARAFDRWRELYDERTRSKFLAARVVRRMRALALAAAVTKWQSFTWRQTIQQDAAMSVASVTAQTVPSKGTARQPRWPGLRRMLEHDERLLTSGTSARVGWLRSRAAARSRREVDGCDCADWCPQ